MRKFSPKFVIAAAFVLTVLGVGTFMLISTEKKVPVITPSKAPAPPLVERVVRPEHEVIGTSVQGRAIEAYTEGGGKTHLLFVGGIHGGYEWNSVLLSYQFIDYIKADPSIIPSNLTLTVIPSLNPDGVYEVVGKEGRFALSDIPKTTMPVGTGRFNAHNVDLNRNFDCNWKPKSMWRGNVVSAGTRPFSEPEASTLRDFVVKHDLSAVIFWHSQSNAVYASACKNGIIPETLAIMNAYAHASGYPSIKSFDAYEITGDAEGWLASIHIPAITVELKTHESVEWERNLKGIKALLEHYKADLSAPE
jgi:hypothetical protein